LRRIYALESSGKRLAPLPVMETKDGVAFETAKSPATIYYELAE
jgi:hypothetical protein